MVGFAPLDPAAVLDLLGRLGDKSLAQLHDSGRYSLLETIRAYARAWAAEVSETSTLAGHHLAWAADFAQRLEKDVERAAPECLDLVERELPNIRAALDHAAGAPDPDHNGLRFPRGPYRLGAQLLGQRRTPSPTRLIRARACGTARHSAVWRTKFFSARFFSASTSEQHRGLVPEQAMRLLHDAVRR